MEAIRRLIQRDSASSSLAFRERIYTEQEDESLIRDCLALANAEAKGARLILLGVRDAPGGERDVVGVDKAELVSLRQRAAQLITRHIEPEFRLSIRAAEIDGKIVGLMHLGGCDDPPYLIKQAFDGRLPVGTGLVRRGDQTLPLRRRDLAVLFAGESAAEAAEEPPVQVGFACDRLSQELTLHVLPVRQLPSELAEERLRSMIEAKRESRQAMGQTETHISRLMHARVWAAETPFEALTDESLVKRLKHTADDYRDADAFYQYEVCAHKLQIAAANTGSAPLHRVVLELSLPQVDGVGITDRIYREDGDNSTTGSYPLVTQVDRTICLRSQIGTIEEGQTVKAFREPPRIWLREAAAGKSLALDYCLTADELEAPICDRLILHVAPPVP